MKYFTLFIVFSFSLNAQKQFDSIEAKLIVLPKTKQPENYNPNVIKAIEAIDRNYREIADTLYHYKSLKHTLIQNVFIETDNGVYLNPLDFGNQLKTSNIVFYNESLDTKIFNFEKKLTQKERIQFHEFLSNNFDYFSEKEKKLESKAVRIKFIKFPNPDSAHVGIDIYGAHFLWVIERVNWNIIKVERLWVY